MSDLSLLELASVVSGGTAEQALAEATAMAQAAEAAGLHRVWVAEHHGMPGVASSSPPVLVAHLASATSRIRIGAGGVMLPNHAPMVVAEQFGTLVALHPGRIDLGIGRAPGSDLATARALRRHSSERFIDDVVELLGYFSGDAAQLAVPALGRLPEVWLLGSSTYSAQVAGMLGLPFSFAYHFNPEPMAAALELYRSTFRPSAVLEAPRVMVAVATICAPSQEEARWLAGSSRLGTLLLRQGRPSVLPSPEEAAAYRYADSEMALIDQACATHLVGTPNEVVGGLAALEAATGCDELLLTIRIHDQAARQRSLELVAEAWSARAVTDMAAQPGR